jgi:hypothetical protein
MRMRNAVIKFVFALAGGWAGHVPGACARNLLADGDFANSLTGWNLAGPALAQWSAIDRNNAPDSGSIRVVNAEPAAGVRDVAVFQCFSLTQGGLYVVSADALVPSGQAGSGKLVIGFVVYPGTTCTGGTGGFASGGFFAPSAGAWQPSAVAVRIADNLAASPAMFQVTLQIEKASAGGSLAGYLDNVSVVRDTLFADAFEP